MKPIFTALAAVLTFGGTAQEMLPPMEGCYASCPAMAPDVEPIALGVQQKTVHHYRITYDYDLSADLSTARGVVFDYYIEDVLPFTGCQVFLKSGEGWYSAKLESDIDPRLWHRCRINLANFKAEGSCAGWQDVTRLRFALTFAGEADRPSRSRVEVANFGLSRGRPDVLVLRSESAGDKAKDTVKSYVAKFLMSLGALGVSADQVSDLGLSADCLAGVGLVVLPWNPVVPEETRTCLESYVKDGGKLMVCGAFPSGIEQLMGVRETGFWKASKAPEDEAITGFVRVGEGLPGQPAFAEQASWQTALLEPAVEGEGQVIARWAGKDGQPSEKTAILKTAAGYSVGHVWFGAEPDRDRLLAAMLADASPKLAGAAEHLKAREAERQRIDAWIATLPPKADERRLMWCHSEKGMRGKDWDGSVRFLKENGFTDLIVNLAWAGTAYYPSEVYPVNPSVAEKGDMFAACQEACRKYGVRMHMWLVTFFLNERIVGKDIVADYTRAGRVQIARDLKPFRGDGGLWLCPSHPDNRREIKAIMLEAARKGADGVHFDYIRYEGRGGCYCERCRHLFEQKLGRSVADWPRAALGDLRDAWMDFRREAIASLVRSTAEEVHKLRPEVEVSAAVMRDPGVGGWAYQCAQDWSTWCAEGWVDFVCPMDYRNASELFGDMVRYQRPMAGKAKIYPGLGATCWTDDGGTARRFGEQVLKCRAAGYAGWTVFDLNGQEFGKVLPKFAPTLLGR